MGRPSKLDDRQRAEIRERLLAGAKPADLAREFGVHRSQILRNVAVPIRREQQVATQLVNAELALRELPPLQQLNVLQFADELRATVMSMASAGKLGAATSARLSSMAFGLVHSIKFDPASKVPMAAEDAGKLKDAAALTQMANQAATIPLAVLSTNRVHVGRAVENPAPKDMGKVTEVDEAEASRIYQDLMRGD